ncbi:hypothetical protein [Endozoicomonas sp.]|uniref:hypothetical protein n=1 Tax=Endozoicomonas sp. TaxID=1892382 RepID=UPI002886A0AA|nr:hypothetical protein [Endozoicomonas sp.]
MTELLKTLYFEGKEYRAFSCSNRESASGETLLIGLFLSNNEPSFFIKSDDTLAIIEGFKDSKYADSCLYMRMHQSDWLDPAPNEAFLRSDYKIYRKEECLPLRQDGKKSLPAGVSDEPYLTRTGSDPSELFERPYMEDYEPPVSENPQNKTLIH